MKYYWRHFFSYLIIFLYFLNVYSIKLPSYNGADFSLLSYEKEELPIVAIVPTYNNKNWYDKNLSSIFNQKYSNYRVIIIDDCSSDGTGDLIDQYLIEHNLKSKCTLVRNKSRKFKMENLYHAVHSCENLAIVAVIDGDDWLLDDRAFSYINELYQSSNVWLTTGGYIEYPSGNAGFCRQIPTEIIETNNFRNYPGTTSQLRTFYAGLFKQIKLEDLFFEGKFFKAASDVAKMIPMFEMAGDRIAYNYRKIYIYNLANTINDHKVDAQLQTKSNDYILNRPKFNRIENFTPTPEENAQHVSADIIVFVEYPNNLDECLIHLSKIKEANKTFIFCNNYAQYQETYKKYSNKYNQFKFVFFDEFTAKSIYLSIQKENVGKFIFFLKDTSTIVAPIYLNHHIKILEKTGAYAWYSKKIDRINCTDYCEIETNIYAFQFGKKNGTGHCAHILDKGIYRKKDIVSLLSQMQQDHNLFEMNFNQKEIRQNKVGLFSLE